MLDHVVSQTLIRVREPCRSRAPPSALPRSLQTAFNAILVMLIIYYDATSLHHNKLFIKQNIVLWACCIVTQSIDSSSENCSNFLLLRWTAKLPVPSLKKESSVSSKKWAERFEQSRRFLGLFLGPKNQRQKLSFLRHLFTVLPKSTHHLYAIITTSYITSFVTLSLQFISLHYTHIKHDFIVFGLNLQPLARVRRGQKQALFGALENGLKNVVF